MLYYLLYNYNYIINNIYFCFITVKNTNMSKKRTRDTSNNTDEADMSGSSSKNVLQKCEQNKLLNIAPVCILFNTFK